MLVNKIYLIHTYAICNNSVDNIINDRSGPGIKGFNIFNLDYYTHDLLIKALCKQYGFTC